MEPDDHFPGAEADSLDRAEQLLVRQQPTEAETIVRTVLSRDGDNPRALDLLGRIAAVAGDSRAALNLFYRAYQNDPSEPEYLTNIAMVLADLQEVDKAIEALDNAIELDPDVSAGYNQKAALLISLGQKDQAIEVAKQAIQHDSENGGAYRLLGYLKALEPDSELHLAAMLLAENEEAGADARINAHYALAYSYRNAGEDTMFMRHIEEGNKLQRMAPQATSAMFRDLTSEVREHLPAHHRQPGMAGHGTSLTPIFIVGMPRSGTSLVEQILDSHPDVHGAGELTLVRNSIVRRSGILANKAFPESLEHLEPEQLDEIAEFLIGKLELLAGGKRFIVDKNPWNFQMVGAFQAILPDAKIIHIKRRPLDNCFSIYTNYFTSLYRHFADQTELGLYYRKYHELMDFWRERYPGGMYDLIYEDLVRDFEAEARKLLDHCGLSWSNKVLEFHKSDRPVRTLSATQVRQPIHSESIGQADKYREDLAPLIESLGDLADPPLNG